MSTAERKLNSTSSHEINIRSPVPQHHLLRRARTMTESLVDMRHAGSPLRQFPVVVHDQLGNQQLHLVRRVEAARTGMRPVPEAVHLRRLRRELPPVLVACLLAELEGSGTRRS